GARLDAKPAETMIPAVNGRTDRPAFSGWYSRKRWRYSVMKKNIANIPDATRNIVRFAVRSERVLKIDRRTSGSFERISMKTNDTSSASAARKRPIVVVEPQPSVS